MLLQHQDYLPLLQAGWAAMPPDCPRRLHVVLGGAAGSSELAKVRRDQRNSGVEVSVFLVLQEETKKRHTCTRKMLRLFMFCFWPGARGNSVVTLALLGHYL